MMETGDKAATTQMEGRTAIKLIQETEKEDEANKSSRKVVKPVNGAAEKFRRRAKRARWRK